MPVSYSDVGHMTDIMTRPDFRVKVWEHGKETRRKLIKERWQILALMGVPEDITRRACHDHDSFSIVRMLYFRK